MSKKKNRPHGHYCKICGEYKANEKFSGKGHAAHICKACSRLSAAEKAVTMDINRLMNFPMRRLSESEKKWLKAKMKDDCQEVADTANHTVQDDSSYEDYLPERPEDLYLSLLEYFELKEEVF